MRGSYRTAGRLVRPRGVDDDPPFPIRKRRRLRGCPYSASGLYVVTLCIQGRRCLLGRPSIDGIAVTPAGRMVGATWEAIPHAFPSLLLDVYVVMPNHLHGILNFTDRDGGRPRPCLGDVIRWFVLAITWGILIGTYSSVYVAKNIVLMLGVKRDWSNDDKSGAAGTQFADVDA